MYRQMIQAIPRCEREIQILEIGAGYGKSTRRFKSELATLEYSFMLDVYDYSETNRFYLSMIVSPTQLFFTYFPQKKYDVILLPEGIRDPESLRKLIHETTIIIIRHPKILKKFLERHFVCSLSNEQHWYFGVYRCYLKDTK